MDLPAVFGPVLGRLESDASTHLGCEGVRLTPLRYEERPFSHVLQVEAAAKGPGGRSATLFVKLSKPKMVDGRADGMRDRVAADFATTRRVYQCMGPHSDLGSVPPVACYPDLLAIVTEAVTGETLLDFLSLHARWWPRPEAAARLCRVMERLGRWIRVYQTTGTSDDWVQPSSLREYIAHRLNRLEEEGRVDFIQRTRGRILQHVDSLCKRVPSDQWHQVPIHSDLALGNVLVSGDRVVVLDFAMAKYGTRLHDLARVCVQTDLLCVKPHLRRVLVKRLQTALLSGFDPVVTPGDPLFRLLVLLHRINHLTGLLLDRASFPESLYNSFVYRSHVRYLHRELEQGCPIPEAG